MASTTSLPGEPAKKASKWNDEETQLNVELRRTGMKWEDIAKRIPGRSSTSCRLRYQNYSEKKQEWNEEKKNTLARLYMRFRKDIWDCIGKEMGLPSRAVEDAIWAMGPDEIASRANHGPFLINPQNIRPSRSPTTATVTTVMHTTMATSPGDDSGRGRGRRGSAPSRSRTHSTSLGGSIQLPPLKEGLAGERATAKSEVESQAAEDEIDDRDS